MTRYKFSMERPPAFNKLLQDIYFINIEICRSEERLQTKTNALQKKMHQPQGTRADTKVGNADIRPVMRFPKATEKEEMKYLI